MIKRFLLALAIAGALTGCATSQRQTALSTAAQPPADPAPAPAGLLGVAAMWGWARRLRKRIRGAR